MQLTLKCSADSEHAIGVSVPSNNDSHKLPHIWGNARGAWGFLRAMMCLSTLMQTSWDEDYRVYKKPQFHKTAVFLEVFYIFYGTS